MREGLLAGLSGWDGQRAALLFLRLQPLILRAVEPQTKLVPKTKTISGAIHKSEGARRSS